MPCIVAEWQHNDNDVEAAQLIYSFQVASCFSCPALTLYRGIRSTFGSVVPRGSQNLESRTSLITVLILIENNLGAKITALNRTLEVRNHVDSSGEWLRSKAKTKLWSLVQHGNSQEIIPYSMALLSHLNQVEPQNPQDVQATREMRQNVTQALAALSVSSLNAAAQVSSALTQSTAVPGELDSALCQERVLDAVERMIGSLEAEREDDVTAIQTGSNILSIIGNTLAAVSSGESSSSHRLALSMTALSKTASTLRSLMKSRDQIGEPLRISTPYIRALGFHGDPSDLLCTPSYPNDSCQFEIPKSFAQRLGRRNPQLVQVVLGIGDALEFNPLLTAADPPITTDVVAMEISTPEGQPVSVQDLEAERAITVTLPWRNRVTNENEACLVMSLSPEENQRNFTVNDLKGLDVNAGLYMAFNFSSGPGVRAVSQLHVVLAVSPTAAPSRPLVTEWPLSLSTPDAFTERTLFLSPLLNATERPLSISLTSAFLSGGPVLVSACVFSALCRFYNRTEGRWSTEGLWPLEDATLSQARCLTQHLTMFGASLFVHPGAVVLLPPPAGPVRTLLAALVCAVVALLHLLLGLVSHRLDHWDRRRLSQVPLCGRPGLYHYRVLVQTGRRPGAGTSAHVGISLFGVTESGSVHLQREGAFQRGGLDHFHLETERSLGEVWKIRLWHDNTGLEPSWYVQQVVVWDPQTDSMFFFLVDDWLSVENLKHGSVEKEVLASCPDELSGLSRVLSSQLLFELVDGHLWWSVWERPAHSHFTRGQRVSCCALSLHLYLALGALWYGALGSMEHSGPVSARMPVSMESVAVGMILASLVFPLQCLLCFLFGKTYSPVSTELSVPPSPLCHSVEMDVYLDQSRLSGPSFMSLPSSSPPIRDSPSSFLELDSSLLDLWASSGLMPHSPGEEDEEEELWPSCTSLLPVSVPAQCEEPPTLGPARLLRRKKALMQHRQCSASRTPRCHPTVGTPPNHGPVQASHRLTTLLTLSDENLMMSITAAEDVSHPKKKNSDSGRDSPTTISPLSTCRSTCSSGWSEDSEVRYLSEDDPGSGAPLYRSASVPSIDSVASTVLPSPPPDCTRCPSTTRIGVARGAPGWLLPSWSLCVVYPLVALLIITCMVLVGLYGSSFSRTVLLMWLASVLSAFLTSALLLEPAKVCVQALLCSALWRPVDPEVEEVLAHETSVVRPFTEQSEHVRPPCGYGLLQAKQEAHKVHALTSLMRHCVCQLLFLMLLLMVNYQDHVEQQKARLLHFATQQHLHRAPMGVPNLTALRHWSDAEQWLRVVLVPHLHNRPSLRLAGLPWLQYTDSPGPEEGVPLGNSTETSLQRISALHMHQWSHTHSLSLRWTQYHPESGLWLCVCVRLHLTRLHRVTRGLSIHALLLPSSSSSSSFSSSSSPPDLQTALSVALVLCGFLTLGAELYSARTERVQLACRWIRWFHFLLSSLSVATGVLQLHFLSVARSCLSELQHQTHRFIDFHRAAFLSQSSSECAAVLLTLLVLKLLGTLRFVRRWVVMGRVLHRARGELLANALLLMLTLTCYTSLAIAVFADTVEGFVSLQQAWVSVLSLLRGHKAVHSLCRVHPHLGSLYSLVLTAGTLWLLARMCGAVLIRAYRSEKAEMFRPTIEPQDYEMVEFFIKRLKLWMGLTKAKDFRHRVKFEGMNVPPSQASPNSRPSTISSSVPSFRSSSPRPLSSLSIKSEDSTLSATKSDVPPSLDRLLPSVTAMLAQFHRVNQITEEVYQLEMRLEDAQIQRQASRIRKRIEKPSDVEPNTTEDVRQRRSGFLHPSALQPTSLFFGQRTRSSTNVPRRTRNSFSESESFPPKPHLRRNTFGATKPSSVSSSRSASPAAGFAPPLPRRRAWHSGSSHSADAAQRILHMFRNENDFWATERPRSEDGARRAIQDGIPKKRKAWILEGAESEQG
ncbi:polycystin-1 [Eucyclogobius newberryi]|uniref:polycystin-1 n=1 Tax=Eucyclogobius newberryi TaxID=166745 RepID=UPI003B5CD323